MQVSYVVRCTIEDGRVFDGFVAWLRAKHVADVCDAGAESADLVAIDGTGPARIVEARYRFPSREALAAYERDRAPRLREDALAELARLGAEGGRGVTFERTRGDVLEWGREAG